MTFQEMLAKRRDAELKLHEETGKIIDEENRNKQQDVLQRAEALVQRWGIDTPKEEWEVTPNNTVRLDHRAWINDVAVDMHLHITSRSVNVKVKMTGPHAMYEDEFSSYDGTDDPTPNRIVEQIVGYYDRVRTLDAEQYAQHAAVAQSIKLYEEADEILDQAGIRSYAAQVFKERGSMLEQMSKT